MSQFLTYAATYPTPAEHTYGTNSCEFIIVHHTGTKHGTIKGVLDGLYRRADYASCHYCVDINGDIYKIGNDTDILWHAGVSEWGGRSDMNRYSIGIEVIGIDSFTDAQRVSVKKLVRGLMLKHKIQPERVLRHADVAPNRKTDVHINFILPLTKWTDWQNSLTNKAMLLDDTIRLLQSLWAKQNDEDKKAIGEMAKRLRDAQKALGEEVTQ